MLPTIKMKVKGIYECIGVYIIHFGGYISFYKSVNKVIKLKKWTNQQNQNEVSNNQENECLPPQANEANENSAIRCK